MYQKNYDIIHQLERERKLIWPANEQLDAMGQLDLHANKTIWNGALNAAEAIPLWENGAPNFDGRDPDQQQPALVFIPAQGVSQPRGTVIVSHGGAFVCRAAHEGFHVARYFASQGFNTAVLSYRLAPYTQYDCLADIQRAVRLLRHKQAQLGITDKIAVMGFSAGGYLSALCAVHNDGGDPEAADPVERQSCRPDALVLCYGIRTELAFAGGFGVNPFADPDRRERFFFDAVNHVTPDMPPAFMWQTISDDPRHSFTFAGAMTAAGVPCEVHCFDAGFHGVGLADGNNDGDFRDEHLMKWADLAVSWLKRHSI